MQKNIILLTIDALRADHLGCMNYNLNITPNIDQLAREGILFAKTIANAPHTAYSLPSLFTSTLSPVDDNTVTLTQILKEHGYKTAAFNPNPEGASLLKKGFDIYEMMLPKKKQTKLKKEFFKHKLMWALSSYLEKYQKFATKLIPYIFSVNQFDILPEAKEINVNALKWVENQSSKFFLWLHYMDVHDPYAPPDYENKRELLYLISKYRYFPRYLSDAEIKKIINLYDKEIQYADAEIGNFIHKLKEKGILDNSYLILAADHGEAFLEHGIFGHGAKIIRGMEEVKLYDEHLHVPLILYGLKKKNLISDRQVQLLDIAPTICELLDISIPPSFEGCNLFISKNEGVISTSPNEMSYRTEDYKLIINKSVKNIELYNLKNDPFETTNIFYENKELAETLQLQMINFFKKRLSTKMETSKIRDKIQEIKKNNYNEFKNKVDDNGD